MTIPFPAPGIDEDNEAFWTGGREGRLMISRCRRCGFWTHPPVPRCPSCHSDEVEPAPASGRGRVYSFTINRQRWSPDLEVPYVIAVVELAEQPDLRLLTNIVGCPADEVRIGMAVEVEFDQRGEVFVPNFHPSRA